MARRSRKVLASTSSTEPQTETVLPEPVAEPAPPTFDHRFREARVREQEGDLVGALEIYRHLVQEDPNDIRVRNNLGCVYEKRGDMAQALVEYEAARAVAPDNVAVLL